jgi:hypothetical protein
MPVPTQLSEADFPPVGTPPPSKAVRKGKRAPAPTPPVAPPVAPTPALAPAIPPPPPPSGPVAPAIPPPPPLPPAQGHAAVDAEEKARMTKEYHDLGFLVNLLSTEPQDVIVREAAKALKVVGRDTMDMATLRQQCIVKAEANMERLQRHIARA